MTNKSWVVRCMIAAAGVWVLQSAPNARAQAPLRAAVFKTAVEQSALTPLAAALDPLLAEQIGKAKQVSIVATPALDLPGLQLAVDCVGETPSCLAVAAERSHAEGVISPSLSRTQTEVVFSLLIFDPNRSAGTSRVVTRRVPVDAGDSAVLSAALELVRETFDIPAPTPPPTAAQPEPEVQPAPVTPSHDTTLDVEMPPPRSPSLVAPITLAIAGVVGVGVGVAFGVMSQSAEDDYAKQHVLTPTDANKANDKYDSASRSALIANVSMGVGAAALIAATVVYIVQRPTRDADARSATRTQLAVGPGHISLQGAWQ